jgi:amino acid transporter
VAEEAQDANATPGKSGVLGMIGIVILFLLMQVVAQMGLTPQVMEQNSASLLPALGDAIFPRPWGGIAILAVLVSTIGTMETQLTQCSRLLFSMGRDRVISRRFEQIHPRFQTPWLASLVITVLALLLLILSSSSESIGGIMTSLISAIGVMVAFYYAMAGFACTWYYRKTLRQTAATFWVQGVWSTGSAIMLLAIAILQLPTLGWSVSLLTIGAIAIGIVPMMYYRFKYRSSFYGEPPEYHTLTASHDLLKLG